MKTYARCIAGCPNSHNKSAFQWSHSGLVAYGANNNVAVVDSSTIQHVTTLHAHRSPITKIAWAPSPVPVDEDREHLYLVSADTAGFMVLFDVTSGKAKQRMSENNKVVNALEMLYINSIELCLLSLHQPGVLVLWSPKSGDQIWKKYFTDPLSSFSRDPFHINNIILCGGNFLQYITDFSTSLAPSDGTKLYLTNSSSDTSSPQHLNSDKRRKSTSPPNDVRRSKLTSSEPSSRSTSSVSEDDGSISNFRDAFYHKTQRNTLILLYSQDILILDMDIRQTVSAISLDRSTSPFVQVYPCRSRDTLYCLHENGTVVLRLKKQSGVLIDETVESDESLSLIAPEFVYESHCSSDNLRITKNQRIHALAVCPTTEMRAAVITSEGKLLIWELQGSMRLSAPEMPETSRPPLCLPEMLNPSTSGDLVPAGMKLSFLLSGVTNSLPQPPFVIKMCPPLTTKNMHVYQPHIALGALNGIIQVYNAETGELVRDLTVHSCQVRGVEWASLHSLVSHACETTYGAQGKSELAFINVKTGKVVNFRQSKPDEGVIQAVRISVLRQYLVIVFRNKPMELWELKTLTLLREMPTDFPVITALEWSPNVRRKPHGDDKSSDTITSSAYKEHFVLTDNTGMLYHYIVEGSIIRDGSKINAEGVSATVSALAWKADLMVLGDVNSNLSFWDLRVKKSKNMTISKGMVRKIRFAPGKENNKMVILFNDEVQVWDKISQQMINNLKFPKEIGRVSDVDWVASDKLALSIADGYIAITDSSLKQFMSPLVDLIGNDMSSLPSLLPTSTSLSLRYQLSHQPWNKELSIPESLNIDTDLRESLSSPEMPIAERCLAVSYLFGDKFSIDFWTVALFYLNLLKSGTKVTSDTDTAESVVSGDSSLDGEIVDLDSSQQQPLVKSDETVRRYQLESCYDVLCDSKSFKRTELVRVQMQDNKKFCGDTRLKCASKYILLGKSDRAVRLLLECESDSSSFYSDSLRACLLATVRSSSTSQSTIKLVATSLIAHSKLTEGVELLCLINKELDACRYLQTYGHWNEAAWLAKVALSPVDIKEVFTRWINEHLCFPSVNEKDHAVLTALSTGDLMKVIEALYSMQCFSLTALFIEACTEMELLVINEKNLPVIEAVFLQYARILKSVNMPHAALHYCKRSGEQGRKLLTELETIN